VRELQNAVERAVLLSRGPDIGLQDLPIHVAAGQPTNVQPIAGQALKNAMEAPERAIILDVLELNNWNRNATADALGINRTTLYKKMKRLGLMEAPRHVRA
jgi:DNA-binding NtrC family response regulator